MTPHVPASADPVIPSATTGTSPASPATAPKAPAEALLRRLSRLRDRVALLVEHRGAADPTAADPLRGLYLSEEAVRHLLEPAEPAGPDPESTQQDWTPEPGDRLSLLAGRLGLTELDVRILLIALAPDLDRTFEPLYGYLNDDVSRRRAGTGLALDLCGLPAHHAEARARFHPSAPLAALGLVVVEEPERPFLSRSLRVPDRLIAHLLGDEALDPALSGHVRRLRAAARGEQYDEVFLRRLADRLAGPPFTAYLREHRAGDGLACAAAALRGSGREALHFTPGATDAREPLAELLREARLRDCAIVVSPLPKDPAPLMRALAVGDVSVLFIDPQPYDPHWCDHRDPLVLDAPRLRSGAVEAWAAALGAGADPGAGSWAAFGADAEPVRETVPGAVPGPEPGSGAAPLPEGVSGSVPPTEPTPAALDGRATSGSTPEPGFDLATVVAPYRLGGDRILRAARAAQQLATFDGTALTAAHLRLAARQQSASGLERHARRIRPEVGWEDLVLPDKPLAQLHELALRARHRDRVLGDWRLSAGGGRGRGVLGLFAGDSGTGKTLSAEVVAAELGLDLYVVQLSSIVDKYVGETEKNLERIFTEADRTDAVLLFDEADSVFGKRSEVKDSHDRYANMESSYLLQRLESFDGIALLTTNLRANIDEAFTRRLDLVIDFPFPDADQRLALWEHALTHVPRADDTDPRAVARDFELAGGSIRSAVVTAAYTAVGRGAAVTAADLLEGARREYRKAGRLVPGEGTW
ncbi:ATP-binding protein [Streptomyces avermitilis]|uniref:ATP-binding protein n=1 Tax=Streptomyces avermitilis TaxID=33903 RepID=UPI003F53B293